MPDAACRVELDLRFDTGLLLPGEPVTFDLAISNTGRLRATALEVRILRPSANQFAAFPLADNPTGVTGGDTAIGYSWRTVGNAADPDGQVLIRSALQSGETVNLPFTLYLSQNYVPGVQLMVTSSLAAGGCGD